MSLEAVPWEMLGGVPPAELAEARLELHHSAQLLGSFGQAHVEPRPDYSHRSMTWSGAESALLSEPTGDTPPVWVALRPLDLTLSLRSGGAIVAETSLVDRTLDDAYRWLGEALGAIVPPTQGVPLDRPEKVIAPGAVADGAPFSGGTEGHLLELEAWFGNAAAMLGSVRSAHAEATPVRCWPHHLDIATLLVLDPDLGAEDGRSVGVGLSPGDEGYALPYWYVTPYPYPAAVDLPDLPPGAHWHREGWVGAILTGDALVSAGAAEDQEAACRAFLEAAIGASKELVRSGPS